MEVAESSKGWGASGGQLDGAGANECGRDVLMGDLVVVVECLAVHDDLQVAEAAAVVERNKSQKLTFMSRTDLTQPATVTVWPSAVITSSTPYAVTST